jgi:hypothetical protein
MTMIRKLHRGNIGTNAEPNAGILSFINGSDSVYSLVVMTPYSLSTELVNVT